MRQYIGVLVLPHYFHVTCELVVGLGVEVELVVGGSLGKLEMVGLE